MESIITTPHKLLIGGDFNIHVEDRGNSDTKKFLELLDNLNLQNKIWLPTHEKGHTLDLLITRDCDDILMDHFKTTSYLSDHAFVKTNQKFSKSTCMTKDIQFRRTKNINLSQLKADITASDLSQMDNMSATEMAELYDRTLSALLDVHAPLISKTIKIKQNSPWYNNELRAMKRKKRKYERRWIRSGTDEDHNAFKQARVDYIKKCNETKTTYYSNEVLKCGSDQRKLYKLIRNMTEGDKPSLYPECVSDQQLCEDFANFFLDKIDGIMAEI